MLLFVVRGSAAAAAVEPIKDFSLPPKDLCFAKIS